MEFTKLVEERRSIRAYQEGTQVEQSVLEELFRTVLQAPSWKNSETGRYYVVTSEEKLKEVKKNCLPEFNQKRCVNAPVLIVTAFEKNLSGVNQEGNPENELGNEWGAYDLGLQNAYLILKAKELGLDTLIMGLRDEEALRKALDIPESQEVASVIALGYRESDVTAPKRKELNQVVTFF